MYLGRHAFQHVYQWNRSSEHRYNGDIAVKLDYRTHIQEPYIQLNYSYRCVDDAAKNGYLDILKLLYEDNGRRWYFKSTIMETAAKYSHLDIVNWLCDNKMNCTDKATVWAAANGRLDILKRLHEYGADASITACLNSAAMNGHLEIVKWLKKNVCERYGSKAIFYAASCGYLEIVKELFKWRHEVKCYEPAAMDYAAKNGYLEIIKYIHEKGKGCTYNAMDYAAENGHLEIVQWLHYNRTEGCSDEAMNNAAKNGHLEIVKWLHDNRTEGCTKTAIITAASNGYLEIVKWLHENRCKGYIRRAMHEARIKGHEDVFDFLECKID